MIFARGTLGAAFHSASVIGRASGSLIAAAWTSSSVMASTRLQSNFPVVAVFVVVLASFMGFCLSGRDDVNPIIPQRVGDEQQPVFHHAEQDKAFLEIIVPASNTRDSKCILEGLTGHFKANAMLEQVARSFGVSPFEFVILHKILFSSSLVNCP